MIEDLLETLKNPRYVNGIPQRGTALWEICQLVEAGLDFPEEEIPFIESLHAEGHFEQIWMAEHLLDLLGYWDE